MKHLSLSVLLFVLITTVMPAHAQDPCVPPSYPLVSVHWNGTHTAWADGYYLYFHSCLSNTTVQIINEAAVTNLTFDAFPLVDNLYWALANGGAYQVNVVTGQIDTLSEPNTPPGDPGGIGGGGTDGLNLPLEVVPESLPIAVPYIKPPTGWHLGAKWWLGL